MLLMAYLKGYNSFQHDMNLDMGTGDPATSEILEGDEKL